MSIFPVCFQHDSMLFAQTPTDPGGWKYLHQPGEESVGIGKLKILLIWNRKKKNQITSS